MKERECGNEVCKYRKHNYQCMDAEHYRGCKYFEPPERKMFDNKIYSIKEAANLLLQLGYEEPREKKGG